MKRILKTLLWTGLTAFAVLIIGFFLLWKFLPEKKIIALVESRSAAAGIPVRIESFAWSLPARFDIREIRVWNGEWQTVENVPFLSLDRLAIRCRILPLLRRRLDITEVKIEGPKVTLDSSFFNMQSGSAKEKRPAPMRPLPLSFRLLSLNAGRFTLRFDIPLTQGHGEAVLGGLNLDVSGITIPRKWLESPQAVRGRVRVFTENAFCDIRLPGNTLKLIPDLDAQFSWTKDRRWHLHAQTGIFTMGRGRDKLAFLLSLLGTGYGDSVRIEESLVSLGGAELARFSGGSARSGGTMRFHVKADGIPADLGAMIQAAGAYLPDSTAKRLSSYDVQGRWNPLEGEIEGDLRQGQFHFGSRLEQACLSSESPPFSFRNGTVSAFASGRFKEKGLENGTVAGKASIDGLSARINDTLTFSTGKILSEIQADLDSRFKPAAGHTGRGSVRPRPAQSQERTAHGFA
jgi:type II secretion system protein N